MNRLADERSPYLRHATHQRIDWYPWSDEPFERARREGKAVFLSSGGVWCHWCHVMARESFDDDETASLLNELFICVKLDRDERPDIDRRYQQAVALMGGAGGWPLSVFLTPDRTPFFGGTYFPPRDSHGRPGFGTVLRQVHEFYRSRKDDADRYGERVMDALRSEAPEAGDLRPSLLEEARDSLLAQYDRTNGGFGTQPKFPMPGALAFLLGRAVRFRDGTAGDAVRLTLDAMARGGFHDQLGGGFHRYSVDEAWLVPHFEKMADDNAWLLRSYLDAYAVFGEERYRSVAEGIVRFVREVLSDPAGGFFASQDADVTPDDEGGYFTWTDRELAEILTGAEYAVLSRHLLHERAVLPHDPGKKVLCLAKRPDEVASELGMPADEAEIVIAAGRKKLLSARKRRQAPFVDRTLYTSLNGMMITSFFRAFRVLGDASCREFALAGLDRVLRECLGGGALLHAAGVPGVLEDHVFLIEALIAAYEATAGREHLDRAAGLMDRCLELFGDPAGGFFDTRDAVLGARMKRIEDIPHPSANAVAILILLKLFHITGQERYRDSAERALGAFASSAAGLGIHAGTYDLALDAWYGTLTLTVEAGPESALGRAAMRVAGRHTVLAYGNDLGRVVPCINETCHAPVTDEALLLRLGREL